MSYTYDIRARHQHGNGWDLHLFENGAPAGLIGFPAKEYENADPDAAKAAFQRAEAEASLWIKGRNVYSRRRSRLSVHPVAVFVLGLVVLVGAYNVLISVL